MIHRKRTIAALAIGALVLPAFSAVTLTLAASPAYAKSSNGQSHGGGKSNSHKPTGKPDKPDHPGKSGDHLPAVQSELKGANASNASDTALEHAADGSRVAMARDYRDAAVAAQTADAAATAAQDAVTAYQANDPGYTSQDIQTQIDALDSSSSTYDSDLAALTEQLQTAQTYETELAALQDTAAQLSGTATGADQTEQEALLALTDGRTLSDDALAKLRANLGL